LFNGLINILTIVVSIDLIAWLVCFGVLADVICDVVSVWEKINSFEMILLGEYEQYQY
jgi:hypothetical protein